MTCQTLVARTRRLTVALSVTCITLVISTTPAQAVTYSGNGSKQIGVIRVTTPSTLRWENDSDPDFRLFLLYDKTFDLYVSSRAASGTSYVPPGTYRNITVAGDDWTFSITSNSAKRKPRPRRTGFRVTSKEAKAETVALMKLEQADFFGISKTVGGKPDLTRFMQCSAVNARKHSCDYFVKGPGGKSCFVAVTVTKALRSRKALAVRVGTKLCGFMSTPPGSPTVTTP